jgi:putative phosphoserine phosphatase/1-acylglycerol-3-phosphate O-acyltransferase
VADPSGRPPRTAFFDVDGTLLPPPSSERRFFRWLLAHRNIGLPHVGRGVLSLLTEFPWSVARFKANKTYLGGEPVDRFRALGAEFVTAAIVPIVRRAAREAIERHQRDGDRTVLLTGTLDLLARPLARALAIDDVVCGQLEQWDGRFTGRSLSPHPYGDGKAAALRDYARRAGIDLAQAAIYGDGWSDLPALRLVGRPTIVNPPPRLRRLAEQRGWAVADWVDG